MNDHDGGPAAPDPTEALSEATASAGLRYEPPRLTPIGTLRDVRGNSAPNPDEGGGDHA